MFLRALLGVLELFGRLLVLPHFGLVIDLEGAVLVQLSAVVQECLVLPQDRVSKPLLPGPSTTQHARSMQR